MNQRWPHHEGWRDSYEHYSHRRHDDDDDYSEDENDDDDDSESSSRSGSGREAAVQSSVISNMDGVNIGNSITIINVGAGSAASASQPGDFPKVKTSGSFSITEKKRSAVTSAAVRAFCDSFGCNPFPSKLNPSMESRSKAPTLSTMSSVNGRNARGNGARGNGVRNQFPLYGKGGNGMFPLQSGGGRTAKFSSWLLFIAILVQLRDV
ncbi:hypothetical protein P3T76_012993 [Phytophthora citrophthora]|uniref:Uncharacterized protein n=1 Tax=Phytophthora citrophthora TaxID=4793 RepID=A0AAD9G3W1_9STRA|nr:hypothetical protein P3T76_012993 [Phytophthora citrophthora]